MTNRRTFLLAGLCVCAGAAVKFDEEMIQGDTAIRLIDATEEKGGPFSVGVRTSVKADHAFVEVFHRAAGQLKEGTPVDLLLHEESLAPLAGNEGYGVTNRNFAMPRDSVQFVRVTFFQFVGQSLEFGR